MKKKIHFIAFLACSLFSTWAFAQNATLKGVVTDSETKETIPGVNISTTVDGELVGAITDFDGLYTMNLPAGTHTLKFSYVSYSDKTITESFVAGDIKTLDIALVEEAIGLDQVVVTGSKFEQKLGEQTVSLEVIKPTLVENSQTASIEQAVEKVPGVDVIDGQANIRGGSGFSYGAGSRVLLLMDDIPVLTADAGFPNWSFLPIENLEQIEIIKGASSALYGSSALNGIINLRTAYPKSEPYTKISLFSTLYQNPRNSEVVTFADTLRRTGLDGQEIMDINVPIDTVQKNWWGNKYPQESGISFAHRQKFNNFDLVLGGYYFDQDSWRRGSYERRGRFNINTRYRVPSVPGLSVGLNINTQINTSGTFLIWNAEANETAWSQDMVEWNEESQKWTPDASMAESDYPRGMAGAYELWSATPPINNKGLRWTIDPFMEYFNAGSGVRHKILGRYFKSDNYTDTDQSTLSDLYYGEYQFQKRFEDIDFTITAGVSSTYGTVDAELYRDSTGNTIFSSTNAAAYLQLDKKFFNKLNVSLGSRYEYNILTGSEAESRPVFRAGINYEAGQATFIRASVGQGYRFPTIAEKFVRTDLGAVTVSGISVPVGIYPNADLTSETGWSAELGFKQGLKISDWKGFVDVSAFINEYNNMMEFTFGASGTLLNIIRDGVPFLGVEPLWPELDTTVVNVPSDAVGFQSVNIGNTRIIGSDISIAGTGDLFGKEMGILAGYTYILPTFQNFDEVQQVLSSASKNILKYRFQHTFKLDSEIKLGKFTPGVSFRYFSFMEAIDEAFNKFLPGIENFRENTNGPTIILDARVLYNITEKSQFSLVVKNITNAEYALRPALMDAPRNFTLKFSHEF
ncbi:MAG: TonB-dependent receptor [Chitinophagales bacterium]